jgi:hypothetical protein
MDETRSIPLPPALQAQADQLDAGIGEIEQAVALVDGWLRRYASLIDAIRDAGLATDDHGDWLPGIEGRLGIGHLDRLVDAIPERLAAAAHGR